MELANGQVFVPAVSPDGTSVAYFRTDGQGANARVEDYCAETGGRRTVAGDRAAFGLRLRIRLDGRPMDTPLTYVHNTTGNTQNVYMQPLAGGPPVQLTHFDSEPAVVAAYAWSRDGKKFAITRARYNRLRRRHVHRLPLGRLTECKTGRAVASTIPYQNEIAGQPLRGLRHLRQPLDSGLGCEESNRGKVAKQ